MLSWWHISKQTLFSSNLQNKFYQLQPCLKIQLLKKTFSLSFWLYETVWNSRVVLDCVQVWTARRLWRQSDRKRRHLAQLQLHLGRFIFEWQADLEMRFWFWYTDWHTPSSAKSPSFVFHRCVPWWCSGWTFFNWKKLLKICLKIIKSTYRWVWLCSTSSGHSDSVSNWSMVTDSSKLYRFRRPTGLIQTVGNCVL